MTFLNWKGDIAVKAFPLKSPILNWKSCYCGMISFWLRARKRYRGSQLLRIFSSNVNERVGRRRVGQEGVRRNSLCSRFDSSETAYFYDFLSTARRNNPDIISFFGYEKRLQFFARLIQLLIKSVKKMGEEKKSGLFCAEPKKFTERGVKANQRGRFSWFPIK